MRYQIITIKDDEPEALAKYRSANDWKMTLVLLNELGFSVMLDESDPKVKTAQIKR